MSERVGFFGGSFDPPHTGHLAIATAAADRFCLTRVLFVPTGLQPLKPAGAGASFWDRYRMVELACRQDMRLQPSMLDAPRKDGSPNYTVDSLTTLKGSEPGDAIFVIVGVDAFREFQQWREPDRLLELAEWVVVSRPGHEAIGSALGSLGLTPSQRARVHALDGIAEVETSTGIRAELAAGVDCKEMLPATVLDYIRAKHLYGTR